MCHLLEPGEVFTCDEPAFVISASDITLVEMLDCVSNAIRYACDDVAKEFNRDNDGWTEAEFLRRWRETVTALKTADKAGWRFVDWRLENGFSKTRGLDVETGWAELEFAGLPRKVQGG